MPSECCTCLKISDIVVDIFDGYLPQKIKTISSVEILPDDGSSSKICDNCLIDVHLLHDFRTQIIKSTKALEENADLSGSECRLCLNVADKHLDILSDGLPHKIETMSSVEILPNDRFSKRICEKCSSKVYSLYRYRNTIISSWSTLVERRIKCEEIEIKEEVLEETLLEIKEPSVMKKSKIGFVWRCPKCDFITDTYKAWRIHSGSHMEPTCLCEICGKAVNRYRFADHKERHKKTLPICNICGKTLANKTSLLAHLRNHKQMKKCECPQCGTVLNGRITFNVHMRRHRNENDKPMKCSMCELRFFNSSRLKTHMRSHTGERPYPCKICGKQFSSGNALKTHIRQHTQETPFTCSYCDAAFKQAVLVRRHMKSKHPEKVVEKSTTP